MGRDSSQKTIIEPRNVEAYLRTHGYPDAELVALHPLGLETQAGVKAYGYGRPLQADFKSGGAAHRIVIRTMSPDPFGHVRRADRADQMILCFDTFDTIPRHIHSQDIGAFGPEGELISVPRGEFFLVTNYVDGKLYAHDLDAIANKPTAGERDLSRARALAKYLADLHSKKVDPTLYRRHLRDTIGSGEGLFGQSDSYPEDHPVATPERLQRIETEAVRWRWTLRNRHQRTCRTHGDFHPFNILFREGDDFSVLDCSRGGVGEAADDVTSLSINYLFFAVNDHGRFDGALRELWGVFWQSYLEASGDTEMLGMVAPYFAWRALVVASPVWYPDLGDEIREGLLTFAERLLQGEKLDPDRIERLLP